jgi:hypothetical protein
MTGNRGHDRPDSDGRSQPGRLCYISLQVSLSPCETRVCVDAEATNYFVLAIDMFAELVYYIVNTALAVCRPLMRGPPASLRLACCGRAMLIESRVRDKMRR